MTKTGKSIVRCAIYTRKSSEEGLEQEFNSLEAQREACEAYIKSQAHEGWRVVAERFDDGGQSGGTLERPALQRLLEKIRARRIDVIVLYKIDRLTRSLTDFARLAEQFDQYGVSFVSVTQAFNTTTSMGRLMLNVLLSFAQFERELTGERIRDKIAASKKKGMWMGGHAPVGYDAKDRTLVINEVEAETVRTLFRLYLEQGTLRAVWREAKRLDLKTKLRISANGRQVGGQSFFPAHIHGLLKCSLYIGRIPHKGDSYPGNHPPIIDSATWDAVQSKLNANRNGERTRQNAKHPSPLAGLLFDAKGNRFTPSHAVKAGHCYRYYVDQPLVTGTGESKATIRRIPAPEIENAVKSGLASLLDDPSRFMEVVGDSLDATQTDRSIRQAHRLKQNLSEATPQVWRTLIRPFLHQVVLHENTIHLRIAGEGLRVALALPAQTEGNPVDDSPDRPADTFHDLIIPARIRVRAGVTKLVIGSKNDPVPSEPDAALIKAVVRAHDWFDQIRSGQVASIGEIAKSAGVTRPYVIRVLRLAFLAPDIVKVILDGRHPVELTVDQLTLRENIPRVWEQQRELLGFGDVTVVNRVR